MIEVKPITFIGFGKIFPKPFPVLEHLGRESERERIKPNSTYSFHLGKEIPNWIIGNSILIIYADPHLQFLYPEPEEPNDAR